VVKERNVTTLTARLPLVRPRRILWQGVGFPVAAAAHGSPSNQVNIVRGHAHRSIAKRHIHGTGVIAASGVVAAVEARGAVAISAFEIGRQRVVVEPGPDHATTVVLSARYLAVTAVRLSHDVGRTVSTLGEPSQALKSTSVETIRSWAGTGRGTGPRWHSEKRAVLLVPSVISAMRHPNCGRKFRWLHSHAVVGFGKVGTVAHVGHVVVPPCRLAALGIR